MRGRPPTLVLAETSPAAADRVYPVACLAAGDSALPGDALPAAWSGVRRSQPSPRSSSAPLAPDPAATSAATAAPAATSPPATAPPVALTGEFAPFDESLRSAFIGNGALAISVAVAQDGEDPARLVRARHGDDQHLAVAFDRRGIDVGMGEHGRGVVDRHSEDAAAEPGAQLGRRPLGHDAARVDDADLIGFLGLLHVMGREEDGESPLAAESADRGPDSDAAGGVEAIFTTLSISEGMLPPTINYEYPDPECDLDYIPNEARPADVKVAMSNSFGFGGHNASIVLKRYDE